MHVPFVRRCKVTARLPHTRSRLNGKNHETNWMSSMSSNGIATLSRTRDGFCSSGGRKEVSIIASVNISLRRIDLWPLSHLTRPGLLAGLYEFPTSANVSKTTSHDAMARIPNKLLSRLLSSTVPPYNKNRSKSQNDALQIKELHFAGDVVHVFSHIKKTYRTQWVVLQGGENLPSFRQDITKQPGKHVEMSDKEKLMDGGDEELSTPLSAGPVWIKLEDVSNAKYVPCHF